MNPPDAENLPPRTPPHIIQHITNELCELTNSNSAMTTNKNPTGEIVGEKPALIWSPEVVERLDQDELNLYVQFASTSCILGGGCNIEQALEVLYKANGNIQLATQQLLRYPHLTKQTIWSMDEVQNFERLKMLHGKNFYLISQLLQTKTRNEVVQFYYEWKKSALRNRSSSPQMSTHSLASVSSLTSSSSSSSTTTSTLSTSPNSSTISTASTNLTSPLSSTKNLNLVPSVLALTPSTSSPSTSDESRDSGRADELMISIEDHKYQHQQQLQQSLSSSQSETFPCKVCGRVFEKVKSRSAHMKRHKNEKLYNAK